MTSSAIQKKNIFGDPVPIFNQNVIFSIKYIQILLFVFLVSDKCLG